MDKMLDQDPGKNHEFLQSVEKLVALKTENPAIRLGPSNNPLKREEIRMSEQETTGVRGPKRKFMSLDVYEKRHGKADPNNVKSLYYKGQWIQGVDIIAEEDVPCHAILFSSVISMNQRINGHFVSLSHSLL